MYKLNNVGNYANRLGTNEWHSVDTSTQFLEWIAEGNIPEPADPVIIPIPACSPRQIRQVLTAAGLRSAVESAVASGSQDLRDWWEFSTTIERNHPEVIAMGAALGQTPEQLDALFTVGATL